MPYKDPEKARANARAYYHAHWEKVRAKKRSTERRYREQHKEQRRLSRARNYVAHAEERRAYAQAYRAAHREETAASGKAYRAAHRDDRRQKRIAYDAAHVAERREHIRSHPEIYLASVLRYQARKRGAAISDFTAKQWEEMQAAYGHRCAYCGRKMERLTMDHLTPLIQGGAHTTSNIVPACQSCNSTKYTGPPLAPVQPLLLTLAAPQKRKPK